MEMRKLIGKLLSKLSQNLETLSLEGRGLGVKEEEVIC